MIFMKKMDSVLGNIVLCQSGDALCALRIGEDSLPFSSVEMRDTPLLLKAQTQLTAYFAGVRHHFDLPLGLQGTPFQQSVWQALQDIPYGEVCTYGDIARKIGRPKACRAVGMAIHLNPLPIIVPCHRVISAGNRLGGYAYGIEAKQKLLHLEDSALFRHVKLTKPTAK